VELKLAVFELLILTLRTERITRVHLGREGGGKLPEKKNTTTPGATGIEKTLAISWGVLWGFRNTKAESAYLRTKSWNDLPTCNSESAAPAPLRPPVKKEKKTPLF